MGRTVLVCGGRTYGEKPTEREHIISVLSMLHAVEPITTLVQGGAPGTDALAAKWAKTHSVRVLTYPANWKKYGKAAGPVRNNIMLQDTVPDVVVAFPGGPGTANMVSQARNRGVPVLIQTV